MKCLINIILIMVCSQLNGQNTYSKIYDVDENAIRNYINDFEVINEEIFVSSITFCDLENSSDATCTALSKYSIEGNFNDQIILDSLNSYACCGEGLSTYNNELIMASYLKGEKYVFTSLIQYDTNLNPLNHEKYSGANSSSNIDNEGLAVIGDYKYLFGNIRNSETPDSVQIIKLNMDGSEVWRKYYSYGQSKLDINSLQSTSDGNLAFILEIRSAAGPNNGFDGYQLMKIDTSGEVLDIFKFEDNGQQPNRLLNSNNGNYYFGSLEHPTQGWSPFSYGMINKMNSDLSTLEWSLVLPNNQLVDGRHYRMFDYLEASNGDIVSCGMAFDNTDTQLSTGVPDKNSTWNGFIIRLTPDGEIVWLHLYKNPNDLLPNDEYGRFRPSRLNKIKELPDGRFIAAGDVFVKNSQYAAIDEQETEAFHLWLLMVDENGCLDGYECDEIIRTEVNADPIDTDSIVGTVVHTWTFEEEEFFGPGVADIDFKRREIEGFVYADSTIRYGDTSFTSFYVEDNKMYFWDYYYEEYVMHFDFNSTTEYDVKFYNEIMDQEGTATVIIDSISYKTFGVDSLKVQHVTILNSETFEDYHEVIYEGIGAANFDIRLTLGCGLCDPTKIVTKLRCFSTEDMTYNFVDYACDSTWITTSVAELESENINVYPNPTSGEIFVSGMSTDTHYQLYDLSGKLLKHGILKNNTLYIDRIGLSILKLKIDDSWVVKKIVTLE